MRRVSEVISMSSIRRFRVRHRVGPFKSNRNFNHDNAPLPPNFEADLTLRYSVPGSNDSYVNSRNQPPLSFGGITSSPPIGQRHSLSCNGSTGEGSGSDSRALSFPTTCSNGPELITPENATQSSGNNQSDNQKLRRTSIDQAIDVSRLVRTVEELFRAVRLLFNPNYPTQFLPHQATSNTSSRASSTSTNSTEEDAITILGHEVEEELEEMAQAAQQRISNDSTFSSESEPSNQGVARNQPLRDSMRKMQDVQHDGQQDMRTAPVTAPVDNFSPQPKRRLSQNHAMRQKSQEKEKESQKSAAPAPTVATTKYCRPLPSYGELYARNQQFDCRYQPVQPILIENFASTFCNTCAYLFAALFVAIPIYLFLLLLLPFASIVRLFQRLCCFEIKGASRMSALESGFMCDLFAVDSVATSLVVLDTKHVTDPVSSLKQALLTEIINKRCNNKHIYQRFRQKAVRIACGDVFGWRDDNSFTIDRHFIPNTRQRFSSVAELEGCLSDLSRQPLPPDRPPWEVRYVENFGGPGSILLICRHHLAIADGVSLVNVLHAAFAKNGRSPSIGQFDDWPPMHHLFTGSTYDFNCLRSSLVGPITVLAAHGVEPHPLNQAGVADPPDSPDVDFDRYEMILSDPMNLDCCTVIKQITHSSLNEIFLSLLAGCIRCYLQNHAIANPPDLKALLPVNLSRASYPESVGAPRQNQHPGHPNQQNQNNEFCPKLQNKYSFAFFKLPVSTEGAVARLWAVRKRYETFSNASDTASIDSSLRMADFVTAPASFQSFARQLFASGFCLVSNLAGSPCQLTIGGCQVSALMFWMPPPYGCNLSFSLFSYRNEVRLGVMARSALMPRPKILTAEFTRQLQQLYEQVAVRTLSMELDTLFPDFTLSAMTQSTIQELEQLLVPIQTQLVHLKAQIDAGDRSLVTLQQIRRLQDRFRCLLIKIKQQQAIRNVAMASSNTTHVAVGNSASTDTAIPIPPSVARPVPSVPPSGAGHTWIAKTPAARSAISVLQRARSTSTGDDGPSSLLSFKHDSIKNNANLSPTKQRRSSIIDSQPLPPAYPIQVPKQKHRQSVLTLTKSQSGSALRSTESMV